MMKTWPVASASLATVQQFCFKSSSPCLEQVAPAGLLRTIADLCRNVNGAWKNLCRDPKHASVHGCSNSAPRHSAAEQYNLVGQNGKVGSANELDLSKAWKQHICQSSFSWSIHHRVADHQHQAQGQQHQFCGPVPGETCLQQLQRDRNHSQHRRSLHRQQCLQLFATWPRSHLGLAHSWRGISGNRINREVKDRPGATTRPKPLPEKKVEPRHNEQIRASQLMVIFPDGSKQVLDNAAAKGAAASLKLDLVEVNARSDPPVVRILDYSKYKHEQQQKADAAEKQQRLAKKMATPKEMQFSARIADHDLEVKLRKVLGFLEDGFRVQLTVKHRREEETAAAEALDYIAARVQAQFMVEVGAKQPQRRALAVLVKPVAQKSQ